MTIEPLRHRDDRVAREALDWVIRLREPDADWAGFSAWLAIDPAHGEAYWPLAEADLTIGDALTALPPATVTPIEPARRRRRWPSVAGWSLAASLVAAIGAYALWPRPGGAIVFESRPGETRAIDLPDGSRVALNGATRLIVDRRHPRALRLDHGEASFEVRHDAADPFTLAVGGDRIADIGTRFDVIREGAETRVAVAEGAISFSRGTATQRLDAGQSLRVTDGGNALTLGSVDPGDVGGWRAHRLVYDRAPLAMIAADLARSTGVAVAVSPELDDRVFTGAISIQPEPRDTITRFATMIDARAARRHDIWVIAPR